MQVEEPAFFCNSCGVKNFKLRIIAYIFELCATLLTPTVISNMITVDIKYYFSIKTLTFATLFIGAIITFAIPLFVIFYKDSFIYATFSLLPLIVVIIGLPDYFRFLYCTVTKKPALELTKDSLIDNSKGTFTNGRT